MGKPIQSWPEQIAGLIRLAYVELEHLSDILTICQKDGLQAKRYVLISHLLPLIEKYITQIDYTIQESTDYMPDRGRGQPPAWRTSRDFLLMSSENLGYIFQEMEISARRKRWEILGKLIQASQREIVEMLEAIEQAPFQNVDQGQGTSVFDLPVSVEGEE